MNVNDFSDEFFSDSSKLFFFLCFFFCSNFQLQVNNFSDSCIFVSLEFS